jgi:hypothetical protein
VLVDGSKVVGLPMVGLSLRKSSSLFDVVSVAEDMVTGFSEHNI